MEFALDKNNKLINAIDAVYGIYYCSECGKPCGLRRPLEKVNHFFHFKIEPSCSLCSEDVKGFYNYKNNEVCNNAVSTLEKNTTIGNWFEAIGALIYYDQLWRLEGCDFSIKPLSLYFEKFSKYDSYSFPKPLFKVEKVIVSNYFDIMDVDFMNYRIEINHRYIKRENIDNKHVLYLMNIVENKIDANYNNPIFYIYQIEKKKLVANTKIFKWYISPQLLDCQIIYNSIKREINDGSYYSKCYDFYKAIANPNPKDYFNMESVKFKDYIYEEYKKEYAKAQIAPSA